METILLIVHVTAAAIVVGALFMQSLAVVMAMRLKGWSQREGVRLLQERMHVYIYYPILAVALITGFWNSIGVDFFSWGDPTGRRWIYWKLVLVVVLAGLGLMTGHHIRTPNPSRPRAMAVHVLIFIVSGFIFYLAVRKPF